jgi:hypothetical protein
VGIVSLLRDYDIYPQDLLALMRDERLHATIKCPHCGLSQPRGRDRCKRCTRRFDEKPSKPSAKQEAVRGRATAGSVGDRDAHDSGLGDGLSHEEREIVRAIEVACEARRLRRERLAVRLTEKLTEALCPDDIEEQIRRGKRVDLRDAERVSGIVEGICTCAKDGGYVDGSDESDTRPVGCLGACSMSDKALRRTRPARRRKSK